MEYIAAKKGGRVWQGSGRGVGQITHYVPEMPETRGGCWLDNALCGAKTGVRSYGWDNSEFPVNCPKCLKKYQSLSTPSV